MTVSLESQALTPAMMKTFPKEVSGVVMELVNKHDVRYRMPDGMHILLYAQDTSARPYKIAAKRPSQSSMLYLARWIVVNVPGFYPPAKTQEVKDLTPEIEEAEQVQDNGKPLIYSTGNPSVCFVWMKNPDGYEYLECTMCNYHQQTARGAHLHEAKHTGRTAEISAKGNETKQIRAAERKQIADDERELAREAARLVAEYLGVIDTEGVEQLHVELKEARAAVDALTKERDDLATKLNMLKEVMGV